ncbi:MAG: enoyl-CoA hydratase/isomerase family protein [Deltaproteobacteria bacterium]|nr:enoyl-CoA hydratase/isomerase family protein [Deltaproteobacteria bacterium]
MDSCVIAEKRGQVALITLNRPELMNSVNFDLLLGLKAEIDRVRFDTDTRVVIITGAGEKAFCAGADLKERATYPEAKVREFIFTIRSLFSSIETLPQPVIAAVNGVALGGGTELSLACDIRYASKTATLGLTETRLAIIPGAGGTQRLPRLIGRGRAKELIFTGRRVSADEALNLGMVNRVCEPGQLIDDCMALADEILGCGPIAIAQAKYAINAGIETDIATGMAIESNAYWLTIPTEDRLEGLAAFREKRKPVYKGK